jgi:hypothetical protein
MRFAGQQPDAAYPVPDARHPRGTCLRESESALSGGSLAHELSYCLGASTGSSCSQTILRHWKVDWLRLAGRRRQQTRHLPAGGHLRPHLDQSPSPPELGNRPLDGGGDGREPAGKHRHAFLVGPVRSSVWTPALCRCAAFSCPIPPSDTRANHTRSELDINRSLVWLVPPFNPKLPAEPLQALRLRILQRRADVAERVDHRVDLGIGDRGRRGSTVQLGLRGGPLRLRLVDRVDQRTRIDPRCNRVLERPSGRENLTCPVRAPRGSRR